MSKSKNLHSQLVFSLSKDDFDWEYSRSGGNGGQKVNKTSSKVRVVHRPSGAVGLASDTRSQLQNRRLALSRLTESAAFKVWVNRKLVEGPTPEQQVERDMQSHNLRVEVKQDGIWVEETL